MSRMYPTKRETVYAVICFLFLFQLSLFAQTGSLRGVVKDKTTKEPLLGANIVIIGTTLGAATDFDGNFSIKSIPVGTQTVEVSYIGYNPLSTTVEITANRTLEIDFELEYKVIEGEAIIVSAQAKGQLQAINKQLSSTGITNIVSAERIQEIPDANAAESVGRLPGVSLKRSSGEGNEVVIRGIQPRLNLITINNIRMPSTNESNTAVGLAGISQYMLDGIEVRKTLRAEDDADVVGGIVDLKLATAKEGFHADVIMEGMYNGLSEELNSYRSSINLSNRFFDNKLGVIAQVNLEEADRTNHALSASYGRDAEDRGVYLSSGTFAKNDITRDRFGATLLLDYELPNGKIQVNSIYNHFDEDQWQKNYVFNVGSGNIGMNKDMLSVDNNNYSLINGISLESEILGGAYFDIGISYTKGHSGGDTKAMQFNYDPTVDEPIAPSFTDNTAGKIAYDIIPYIRDTATNYQISRLYMEERDFDEDESSFQANLKIPVNVSRQLSGFIKFGGKMRFKNRDYDYSYDGDTGGIYGGDIDINEEIITDNPEIDWPWTWANRPTGVSAVPAYPIYESGSELILEDRVTMKEFGKRNLIEQIVDRAKASNWANIPAWNMPLASDLADDYDGDEKLYAAYLMADLSWGKNFSLNAGIRYEKEETEYKGYGVYDVASANDVLDSLDNVKRTNDYFLPSVTLQYNYSAWGDVRFAYTQSLARPEYYAFIPHYSADLRKSFSEVAGNPHLEPALSHNFDLIFSFYGNYMGLFTIGGFYKEIDKFFYQANFEVIDVTVDNDLHEYSFVVPKGQYINLWRNLDKTSYLRGLEIDWQTNFWYLPVPFNGVVLGANYTKISSKAYYYTPHKETIQIGPNPWEIEEVRVDSFQTQQLVDQPNDIFNLSFGYDYKDFSMRIAYYFQGKTISYVSNYKETDGYSQDYSRLDLSVRQKLPVKGLSVQFLLSNITEEADESYTFTKDYNNSEQYYGMTGSLGVRYEF